MNTSTICALSTPQGVGGLAVIRVSGPDAIMICDRVFSSHKLKKARSHSCVHGYVTDFETKEVIDEVVALVMKGPRTFTGEDTVEIDCHGGMYICRRILESLIAAGCSMAQPGEFSKRAFLSGRMDLNEAEAVMDMIGAETGYSLKAAVSQLKGTLSSRIEDLRKILIDTLVAMEVNIDYPEYDVPEITDEEVLSAGMKVLEGVNELLSTADSGMLLRSGIAAALVGRPNAGKSSLMNALLKTDRAIVTEIPGTTRDTLEESLDLDGIKVRIIDTAGIHDTGDVVEKIGVERSERAMQEADLILWVVDASGELSEEDLLIRKKLGDKPVLLLLNKSDISLYNRDEMVEKAAAFLGDKKELWEDRAISISAKQGEGLELLSAKVKELFFSGNILESDRPLVTNMRQKETLLRAKEALERVTSFGEMPQDLMAIDLTEAADALAQVGGKTTRDEVITEIFSRFCLGK